MSTRQRLVGIDLDFPCADQEVQIVATEAGVPTALATTLVAPATAIRTAPASQLREVASTRTLVAAAALHLEGLGLRDATRAAVVAPLSDDPAVRRSLEELLRVMLPAG